MPQIDIDGANSKISADTIQGQSGTTVTVQSGHNLAGSGSGLTALPAANLTGTLPAISGANLTSLPSANTSLSNLVTAGQELICSMWIEFSGPTTIKDSNNVSSITDNSTGNQDINFAVAMDNANYAATAGCSDSNQNDAIVYCHTSNNNSTTSVNLLTQMIDGTTAENASTTCVIFGGKS